MPKKYIVRLTPAERETLQRVIQKQQGVVLHSNDGCEAEPSPAGTFGSRKPLHQRTTQQGSAQKVRRAQILLKADADGSDWTDQRIAEAFDCRTKTVENLRQRLVVEGFDIALHGKKRSAPPVLKKLTGEQEAQIIALRLGDPPAGFGQWSLRLLAQQVVELGIVESISHETVRHTLKQTV